MKHAGLNPTDLHKRTGLSRDVIYRLVKGEGFPAIATLIAVGDVLGVEAPALLDGALPPPGTAPTRPLDGLSALPGSPAESAALAQLRSDLETTKSELADLNDRFATAMELIAPRLAASADADAQLRTAIQRRAS